MEEQTTNTEKPLEPAGKDKSSSGMLILVITAIVIVCLIIYGYFTLAKFNQVLTQTVTETQNRAAANHEMITALQKSVDEMQQSLQKSQDLASQQEAIMAEWRAAQKGDLNKWHVAEAQYLVNLANDHLQYSHDVKMATILLTRADQVLASLQDASVLEIRKSIADDLANLQAAPQIDETSLYLRVAALNDQIDQLPLPVNPLKVENTVIKNPVAQQHQAWWREGLDRTWQVLQKIVVVRRYDSDALPLVLPDEKVFLYQNLHAQMEDVLFGVLHHNAEIYQNGLARAAAWTKEYFAQDQQATKNMLQNLEDLRKINVQPVVVNLTPTIQLFDNYFAQSTQSQQAAPAQPNQTNQQNQTQDQSGQQTDQQNQTQDQTDQQ